MRLFDFLRYKNTLSYLLTAPGERYNARNDAIVHAGDEDHARPGWTASRRGQDSPWKSQSE